MKSLIIIIATFLAYSFILSLNNSDARKAAISEPIETDGKFQIFKSVRYEISSESKGIFLRKDTVCNFRINLLECQIVEDDGTGWLLYETEDLETGDIIQIEAENGKVINVILFWYDGKEETKQVFF